MNAKERREAILARLKGETGPVSATALYGWMPLSPFALALSLVALSCACAWWLLHRADLEAHARD